MASNNIIFKIGSTFEGEAFKRARQVIASVNNNIKQGSSAATNLAGAFADMDGAASKSMQALTGLVGAIATFNAAAIVSQVTMMAINAYFADMKEKAEAAKKQADELHASMEQAFSSALTGRMNSVNAEVKALSSEFDRITKQASDFAAALEGVRSSQASGGIVSLQVEKLNALLEAHSDAERATIEAQYNLKIAIEKSANVEAEWQAKIDEAQNARVTNDQKIANIGEQLATIEAERRQLEETMLVAKQAEDGHWLEIQKQVNVLKEKEAVLEQQKNDALEANAVLDLKLQKVKQDAENAQAAATVEIRNAELAEVKLNETRHAAQVKLEAKLDREEEHMSVLADQTEKIRTAAEIQDEVNKAAEALKNAELAYASKMSDYINSGMATFDAANGLVQSEGKGLRGGQIPVDVQKSIQTTVADQKVDDAIRNGAVSTVKEMGKLNRQGLREARDLINKTQNQQLREAQAYKRLKEMNPKALASSDKVFMANYEKLLKANEDRKQELKNAKDAVDKQAENVKKTADNLDKLVKMMAGLGLK